MCKTLGIGLVGGLMLTLLGCSGEEAAGRERTGAGAGGGSAAGAAGSTIGGAGNGGLPSDMNAAQQAQNLRGSECASFSQEAENTLQPADIVWVVDNGGSIQGDIAYIQDNINRFSQDIASAGIDIHIVMITDSWDPDVVTMATPVFGGQSGDWRSLCVGAPLGSGECPNDSNLPTFLHVDFEVGSGHDIIPVVGRTPANVIIDLYDMYKDVLRPNATKAFIVMTEADAVDAPNNSAAAFTQNVEALDGGVFKGFVFHGVIGALANVYRELITQSGGAVGDLNAMDFQPVFDAITQGVIGASELDCEWAIPPVPDGQVFNPNKVNVVLRSGADEQSIGQVPSGAECPNYQSGWYYDNPAAPTMVHACPQSCDLIRSAEGSTIDVLFGCETVIAPPD